MKNCFAKRFAAKEAFSKALGTGISKGINFNQIVVLNEKNGKPCIKLIEDTKKKVEKTLISPSDITESHLPYVCERNNLYRLNETILVLYLVFEGADSPLQYSRDMR